MVNEKPGIRNKRAVVGHASAVHVGLPRGVVGLVRAVARNEPECQRMRGIDRADTARRHRNGDPEFFGEGTEFPRRAAVTDALSNEDDGALCRHQHVDRLRDAFGIRAAAARDIGVPILGPRRFLRDRLVEHIEGHVEHHRRAARSPWSSAAHEYRQLGAVVG
jgi:hypothetical protein